MTSSVKPIFRKHSWIASNCSLYSLLETMSCITLRCWLSIYLQDAHCDQCSSPWWEGKDDFKTCQTAVLTWEESCLAACKSSACFGGKVQHICNKICESFSPPWKENEPSSQKYDKGNSKQTKPEKHIRGLFDDPRLLQQVLGYLGPDDRSSGCELHLQVFAEAAGVVIDRRAGVSEGLYERVDLQDLLTQRPIVCLRAATCSF